MELTEYVVLPLLTLALVTATLASWRRHRARRRWLFALAAAALDAWLWLVAFAPPLGPHDLLVYALLLVNVPIALGLVYQGTGFQVHGGWYDTSDPRQNIRPE